MKKISVVMVFLCAGVFIAFNIIASFKAERDEMPVFLEPLRVEFSKVCMEAKWKYGVGITDRENLTPRLEDIIKRRDALLKQRGIRSFKVQWSVEDFADGQSIKPNAHFSGWYLD